MNRRIKTVIISSLLIAASAATAFAGVSNSESIEKNKGYSLEQTSEKKDTEEIELKCDIEFLFIGCNITISIDNRGESFYYEILNEYGVINDMKKIGEPMAAFPELEYGDKVTIRLFDKNKKLVKTMSNITLAETISFNSEKPGKKESNTDKNVLQTVIKINKGEKFTFPKTVKVNSENKKVEEVEVGEWVSENLDKYTTVDTNKLGVYTFRTKLKGQQNECILMVQVSDDKESSVAKAKCHDKDEKCKN